MKTLARTLAFMCFLIATDSLFAQSETGHILVLDIAELNPGEKKSITGNATYDTVILKNTILGVKYSFKVSRKMQELPSLASAISGLASVTVDSNDCLSLRSYYNSLAKLFVKSNPKWEAVDEKQVSKAISSLETELKKSTCSNSILRDSSFSLINNCKKIIPKKIIVQSSEIVTITITRADKEWTWELVGDPIGEWVMSYGFGFCSTALAGKTYHLQQMDDTTTFKITQDEKPGTLELAYIPAIFYSFLPASKYNSRFNWSISAGLGFDLSAPVVFFGGGFMYRQNIGVNMGVAFQQQSKLYPQYSDGQILTSSMQDAQLHKQVYRPNLFISVNFRFDKSKDNEIKEAMKPK